MGHMAAVDDVSIRSTLASFDVKKILFDFRNIPSACKYFILKIFQSHILKIIAKNYGNAEKIMKKNNEAINKM